MCFIQGENNDIIFVFPDRRVSIKAIDDVRLARAAEQAVISVTGNDNLIVLHFDSEASAEELSRAMSFLL